MGNRLGFRLGAAPALALVVLATGCGSGGGSATTGGGTTQPKAAAGGDFCAVVRDELNALKTALPKDYSAPDQMKAYGAFIEQSNAKLVAAAPGEIRADVQTQAQATSAVAASWKTGVRPSADALAQLRTPQYKAASTKVAAYIRDKCGISPSVAPTG